MTGLPPTHDALVLRTDFSDDQTWLEVCGLIGRPDPEHGFVAYVECVSDPRYDGLAPAALVELAEQDPESRTYLFVVDLVTVQDPEHPVLVLDLYDKPGRTFRVTPAEMWGVENNLSISNMDFIEFADAVDEDGVFRGFPHHEQVPSMAVRRRNRWWHEPWVEALVRLVTSLLLVAGGVLGITQGGAWNITVGACGVAFFGFAALVSALSLRRDKPQNVPPPSVLPDEVRRDHWFDDEELAENDLTAAEVELLDALRERARSLPAGWVDSFVTRQRDTLIAVISISDQRPLADFGVHINDRTLRGGRLTKGYSLREGRMTFEITGSEDELVQHAIDWFERVIRRPLNRLEWWHKGRPYAIRYVFADTGEGLLEGFAAQRTPRGIPAEAGIGEPDATVVVRIDGRALNPPFAWFEYEWRPL